MDLGLRGKTAVVTGGSKGIGFAVAKAFLQEGARVAVCARSREGVEEAVRALSAFGEAFGAPVDAEDARDVYRFAEEAAQRFGSLDCWVNNVGATVVRQGTEYTPEDIAGTVSVCFNSAVYGCQAAFRHMKAHGGSIVNIASLAARCGTAGRSTLYGPLKAAVVNLAVMYAAEYAAYGIRVNAVLPGFTATPAVRATIPEAEVARNAEGTLLRRVAEPEEIAWPVVFVCSGRAGYITAASLEVSGGRSVVLNPAYSYDQKKLEETSGTV